MFPECTWVWSEQLCLTCTRKFMQQITQCAGWKCQPWAPPESLEILLIGEMPHNLHFFQEFLLLSLLAACMLVNTVSIRIPWWNRVIREGFLKEELLSYFLKMELTKQRQGQCTYIAKELTTAISYLLQWLERARKPLEKFLRSSNPSLWVWLLWICKCKNVFKDQLCHQMSE